MPPLPLVAVIGGGFSGLMTALHLVRAGTVRVRLIEKSANFAQGAAYCTANPDHLLNVRAGNMSAWPDEPGHFARWLAERRPGADAFASRGEYGLYLQDLLATADGQTRLSLVADEAAGLVPHRDGWRLDYASGSSEPVDAVVLALGNPPPATPAGIGPEVTGGTLYHADPWRLPPKTVGAAELPTLLIGSGLTMVDVALSLARSAPGRPMIALSRRGLAPLPHAPTSPLDAWTPPADASPTALLVWLKSEARRQGWREAIDALRPYTQAIWRGWNRVQRARFLRHARPYWDVHRHRLAPNVAERVDALVSAGRLRFAAGKIVSAAAAAGGAIDLSWRPRGVHDVTVTRTARIVNCTGPQGDLLRSDEPLIRHLIATGAIRPDPLRLGVDVDAQSRAIGRDGRAEQRLHCIGPMTRGGLWEVVAVPDIRQQSWDLARRLSNAQWVGGEGL